jgi:hypothetical protein
MRALSPSPDLDSLPLIGKDYLGRAESMIFRRRSEDPTYQFTIRVWDSGARFEGNEQALYLAQVSREVISRRLSFFAYWKAEPAEPLVVEELQGALSGFQVKEVEPGLFLLKYPAVTTESGE